MDQQAHLTLPYEPASLPQAAMLWGASCFDKYQGNRPLSKASRCCCQGEAPSCLLGPLQAHWVMLHIRDWLPRALFAALFFLQMCQIHIINTALHRQLYYKLVLGLRGGRGTKHQWVAWKRSCLQVGNKEKITKGCKGRKVSWHIKKWCKVSESWESEKGGVGCRGLLRQKGEGG